MLNPQQFNYPKTEDDDSQGSHVQGQFAGVHRLHGAGDPDALFHGEGLVGTPWPKAAGQKGRQPFDGGRVRAMLLQGDSVSIEEVDPRFLHATQPSVTRAGVMHYMKQSTLKTGRTFADQGDPANRHPVVYEREDGKNLILSGHHRATTALIKGRPLRARRVQGGWGTPTGA